MRAGSILRAALFALALPAVVSADAAAQIRDDTTRIADIDFDGNDRFGDALLRTAIISNESSCANTLFFLCWLGIGVQDEFADPRALGADALRLQLFYYERGYRGATVQLDTTRSDDGLEVAFRIHEGEPVRVDSVAVLGLERTPPELVERLPLTRGAPLDLTAYEAARDTLVTRLRDRGFADADVLASYLIPTDAPRSALVEYELIPGDSAVFGTITVQGANAVSPAVVRRMLGFAEGDRFSRRALLSGQRNLFSLEVFRHAEIERGVTVDGEVPITVRVNEGDLHRVRTGVGLNTLDYLHAEARWTSRNFLGGARRLEIRGRISNLLTAPLDYVPFFAEIDGLYSQVAGAVNVDFRQPWFFHPRNTFGAGLFAERYILPPVYVRSSAGAYASVARSISTDASLTIGYRPELTQLDSDGDLIFCVNFVACEPADIRALREPHWLAPLSAAFVRDRTNSLFAPSRGFRLRFEAETAARFSGSDFEYARFQTEATSYWQAGRNLVVAARLAGGIADALGEESALGLHPQKRFFSGGANSVRGFAQYRLGPKLLTIDAVEQLIRPVEDVWDGCSPQQVNAATCNATALALAQPGRFDLRPVGGAVQLEGNLELRFPVFGERLRGAAFLDAGEIWADGAEVRPADIAFTPGLGVRYFSPIGPIRIDVGYNGRGPEQLSVVTTGICQVDGCAPLEEGQVYEPDQLQNSTLLRTLPSVRWDPYGSFIDRLQLHFSIGQAF